VVEDGQPWITARPRVEVLLVRVALALEPVVAPRQALFVPGAQAVQSLFVSPERQPADVEPAEPGKARQLPREAVLDDANRPPAEPFEKRGRMSEEVEVGV